MEEKYLQTVFCPYCGALALEETPGLASIWFIEYSSGEDGEEGDSGDLNEFEWAAYECDVCERVVVLDKYSIQEE